MKDVVRIREIELNGFKNVSHGIVQMPSALEKNYFTHSSDVLGIYGQNGSGKTAVIEALEFVQKLLMGAKLPDSFLNYIKKGTDECTIRVGFDIESVDGKDLVDYIITTRIQDESFMICREVIKASKWIDDKFSSIRSLISYDVDEKNEIAPLYRYKDLVKFRKENKVNLTVAKRISQKEKCSFIFGSEGQKVFSDNQNPATNDYRYIVRDLREYATMSLFVINSGHSATISMNFLLPFSFKIEHDEGVAKGDLPIRLDQPSLIREDEFNIAEEIIREMNIVLCTLIPGLSIELHNYGIQKMENGNDGYRVELLSKRGDTVIPLSYESEGIIKIISILNVLMCVYNSPGMCLVIDELDSGVFEFLLGEILAVIDKGAKGQIIFTSHNLRALEMIDKRNLAFATTNPDNRYIHLTNVKKNNNLRDLYLRTITLGGQNEEVYAGTDSVEIGRAFRRVGRMKAHGNEK